MSKIRLTGLTEREEFREASKEELRVLVALIERPEKDVNELSELCAISKSRASAALHFWQTAGVLSDGEPSITEEFEERLREGEIDEEPSVKVARDIRDNSLAEMLEECAMILNRSTLPTQDAKALTALVTQYGLTAEYVAMLAHYLKGARKTLTPKIICNEAIKLVTEYEINDTERLNTYITEREQESSHEWEIKFTLGIRGRSICDSERRYYDVWSGEYGFGSEIIKLAISETVAIKGERRLSYAHAILSDWHKAGCRTVTECQKRLDEKGAELAKEYSKSKKRAEPERPRYGDFDVNDAFQKALERSFKTLEDSNSDK